MISRFIYIKIIIQIICIISAGTQGVGKSMIMNLISQDKPIDEICNKILTSHDIPITNTNEDPDVSTITDQIETVHFVEDNKKIGDNISESSFKFKMQDIEEIQHGIHCTKGKRDIKSYNKKGKSSSSLSSRKLGGVIQPYPMHLSISV